MMFLNQFKICLRYVFALCFLQLIVYFFSSSSYAQTQQPPGQAAESKKQSSQPTADAPKTESGKSDPPTFPTVTVEGKAAENAAGYVAKRSNTSTKTDTPILETPQSVTV